MVSKDGRYVLTFNGEVYNYLELRKILDQETGIAWRGHSDTEVFLEAIASWGLVRTLDCCNGMFAFAVWDRHARQLTLGRDRTGEKPLYVGWLDGDMVFGSELRAIRRHASWRHAVNADSLEFLLRLGYVPAPLSIHPGVFKIPAGTILTTGLDDAAVAPTRDEFVSRLTRYWSLADLVHASRLRSWEGTWDDALDALQTCIDDAVKIRMLADVPVGALFSGGIDSTLVVSSMQRQSMSPTRTFTVGFEEGPHNESDYARRLASHLGTEHDEVLLPGSEALDLVDRLPDIYDEPFADAAQLPAALVCSVARQRVTVALTGDGGDELFNGYQRYLDTTRLWSVLGKVPLNLRRQGSFLLEQAGNAVRPGRLTARMLRQSSRVKARNFDDLYARTLSFPGSHKTEDVALVHTYREAWPVVPDTLDQPAARARFIDQALSLPEGIHTKLDRASMRSSLELRLPLLDPRLIQLSWRMPEKWMARGRTGKPLLRALLGRHVPMSLWARPKQGFDVPVASWLRGPLKTWASDLLSANALASDTLIDANWARHLLQQHLDQRADHGYVLWSLLMYRSWCLRYAGNPH